MINPQYRILLNRSSANLLDPDSLTIGYRLNTSNGELVQTSSYNTSDFMKVQPSTAYSLRYMDGTNPQIAYICFYDKNKSRISGYTSVSQPTSDATAAYARISLPSSYDPTEYFFAVATTPTFVPYISPIAKPIYGSDLQKTFEQESGEEFFRAKLNTGFTFLYADYDFIMEQEFDFRFELTIEISYDLGASWSEYWKGEFWKTDCEINEDDKNIVVTPSPVDEYTEILDGIEKEYDLIQLAPVVEEVWLDKRSMIQIYTPGESVVGCFMAGMWWEEDCSVEEDINVLTAVGDDKPNFKDMLALRFITIKNRADIVDGFAGEAVSQNNSYEMTTGAYKFKYIASSGSFSWQIVRASDGTVLWYKNDSTVPAIPYEITLAPNTSEGVSGDVVLAINDAHILARFICDVDQFTIGGTTTVTYEISDEDFVFNNRNFRRVCQYNFPNSVSVTANKSTTPTKWGIYQPGIYYVEPSSMIGAEFFPITRSYWGVYSIWFNFPEVDHNYEVATRKEIRLKNAYPLSAAISAILSQIAPDISHDGTTDYSEFLYGQNPLSGVDIHWMMTPKSNILVGEYDQPAQKAPVTLRQILDMLRDCFRCYWFVEDGKLRIEHIFYFMNGGSYSGTPTVGRDLTVEYVKRNGKKWGFCTSKYAYDKANMPARYEFGWMDDETQYFDGSPIDIISNYVQKDDIQKISVSSFSSDVDFLMLEPNRASNDGFVLLGATIPAQTNLVTSTDANSALISNGSTAVLSGYCVSNYIAVKGKNIRAEGSTPFGSAIYVKYAVYDENQHFLRYGRDAYYVYQEGDVYVRFTFDTGYANAYYDYYKLPYYNWQIGVNDHWLQNGLAAFVYLENFYLYDLPAKYYSIDGAQGTALGIKKNKTQTLKFPCYRDPDLVKLIKTYLGNGKIGKLSINLSSRSGEVTLKYDTEEL